MLIITEKLIESASAVSSSTQDLINPSAGMFFSCSTAILTSIAAVITNEYISILKICYTRQRDWINVLTLLLKKTLKTSMVDKKIDQKET